MMVSSPHCSPSMGGTKVARVGSMSLEFSMPHPMSSPTKPPQQRSSRTEPSRHAHS